MKKFLHSISCAAAVAFCVSATPAFAAETVLAEGDFSILTAGSEEEPEIFTYSFNYPTELRSWKLSSYSSTGQAGGALYLSDGASVQSSSLSGITKDGGAIKVSVEVKLNKADMGIISLKWGYSTSQTVIVETSDWTNIDFFVTPTSTSSYSNYASIAPQWLADGIFIKSIKIAQSPEFLAIPEAVQPADANGTSFTASWKSVTGATKYLLDVYSYNAEGDKVMFLDNQECTSTSYKVEGLNPATTYYYVVRAANETGISANSAEIEVVKYVSALAAPVVEIASCDENGNFTATWDAVADADGYSVAVFKNTTLTEAGQATILEEDFNAFTTGSLSDLNYVYNLDMLNEPGWTGYGMSSIEGAIGIDPFGSEGYILTPELDLSADNGKVSIAADMAAYLYGSFVTDKTVTFAVIDANEKVLSSTEITINKNGFSSYAIDLTGATTNSKIKISSNDKILIDNIAVKQILPAGSVSSTVYLKADTDATEYTGKVEFAANTEYTFVAVATGRTVAGGEITGITSEASAPVAIVKTSGIADVTDTTAGFAIAKAGHGIIAVSAATATTVEIYDIAGRLIAAVPVAEGTSTIAVQAKGIVIVKAGTAVAKLAL